MTDTTYTKCVCFHVCEREIVCVCVCERESVCVCSMKMPKLWSQQN